MSEQAKELLGRVAELAKKSGRAPSYIGMLAVKDARIVEKLERGAVLLSTAAKLAKFLDEALTPTAPSATDASEPMPSARSGAPVQSARPKSKPRRRAAVKAPKNVAKGRARAKKR